MIDPENYILYIMHLISTFVVAYFHYYLDYSIVRIQKMHVCTNKKYANKFSFVFILYDILSIVILQ